MRGFGVQGNGSLHYTFIMKDFGIINEDLKKGYEFKIETIDKDDLRLVLISISTRLNKYTIWFNGSLIHTCKTFPSVLNRLKRLNKVFPLESESVYN